MFLLLGQTGGNNAQLPAACVTAGSKTGRKHRRRLEAADQSHSCFAFRGHRKKKARASLPGALCVIRSPSTEKKHPIRLDVTPRGQAIEVHATGKCGRIKDRLIPASALQLINNNSNLTP
jgi:hypothetical protein